MFRVLLLALALARALHAPTHPERLPVLAEDLRATTTMVASEAARRDPQAPATDRILLLSRLSFRFERLVPAFQEDPAELVEDFRDLVEAYEGARVLVERSGSRELALRFQGIQMLMAKLAMDFGDDSLAQTDFTPGAILPRGEDRYTPEGLAGLVAQVHILSNQVLLRSPRGTPRALAAWSGLVVAAARVRQGEVSEASWKRLHEAWLEALPLFFELEPDERTQENYSLLLSNYVRLRAARAQVPTPRP